MYVQNLINQTAGPWRAAAIHASYSDPAFAVIPADPKPIRYYFGTRDHIANSDTGRYVAHELAELGHDVDIQLIPNHTHWFYNVGPMIAEDAWEWLSRQ